MTIFEQTIDEYAVLVGQRDDARRWAVHLEQENARLWLLATCRLCNGPAESDDDREQFLANGAHFGCLADQAHDEDIAAEAEWGDA